MQNLRIIENELVPVYETSTGEKVVYGTELHEVLEVKSRFNDWMRNRLSDCEATENEDYETLTKNLVNGGQAKEYIIKLDTAKEMAMLERNEKGKQVRRYFIQVEKKYKENTLENLSTELKAIIMHDKKIQQVEHKVNEINDDLQQFKQELPLFPVDADDIRHEVNKVVIQCLGGKESNAYKDRSLCRKVYCDIYKELKRQFDVSQYKYIKQCYKEKAIQIIKNYKLPMVLAEQIQDYNAQVSMEIA